MALAGRWAGIVSGVLVLGMLVAAGCQAQRAETPAARPEAVGCVPAWGARPGSPEDVVRGRTTYEESAHDGTPSATISDVRQEKPEPIKAEPSGTAVELALKFVPGQTATYKITTEHQKSVEWKGAAEARPAKFTDGRTGNHVELTFEQRVQSALEDGAGVLEITIKGLKYLDEVVNKVVFDFDSARPEDANNPLAALVGKSYQVRMSPQGRVLEISHVEPVRQAVPGGLPGRSIALRLLSEEEIRNRHEIAALSALQESPVRPGQSWSSIRTFSFDDLGGKTYERVYTLKSVGGCQPPVPSSPLSTANRPLPAVNSEGRVAVVDMKAIPSTALAQDLHQRQAANPFARMSDNTDSYEGRLVLDLDNGRVREYTEQMQNEWIIADPAALQTGRPAAIRMAARQWHRLEPAP